MQKTGVTVSHEKEISIKDIHREVQSLRLDSLDKKLNKGFDRITGNYDFELTDAQTKTINEQLSVIRGRGNKEQAEQLIRDEINSALPTKRKVKNKALKTSQEIQAKTNTGFTGLINSFKKAFSWFKEAFISLTEKITGKINKAGENIEIAKQERKSEADLYREVNEKSQDGVGPDSKQEIKNLKKYSLESSLEMRAEPKTKIAKLQRKATERKIRNSLETKEEKKTRRKEAAAEKTDKAKSKVKDVAKRAKTGAKNLKKSAKTTVTRAKTKIKERSNAKGGGRSAGSR